MCGTPLKTPLCCMQELSCCMETMLSKWVYLCILLEYSGDRYSSLLLIILVGYAVVDCVQCILSEYKFALN